MLAGVVSASVLWPFVLDEPRCLVAARVPDLDAAVPQVHVTCYAEPRPAHAGPPAAADAHLLYLVAPRPEQVDRSWRGPCGQDLRQVLRARRDPVAEPYGDVTVRGAPTRGPQVEIDELMACTASSTVAVLTVPGAAVVATRGLDSRRATVVTLAAVERGGPGPMHLYASALHALATAWGLREHEARAGDRWPLPAAPWTPPDRIDLIHAGRPVRLAVLDVRPGYWPDLPAHTHTHSPLDY